MGEVRHAVSPVVCMFSFLSFRRAFLVLSLTGSQVASTGGRCTVNTGEPQQSSHTLLITWLGSLSMVVQAEPVKLVTGKLKLVLLPSIFQRWAIKGSNIRLNIKIIKISYIG